jgi:cytochrome P450
VLLGPTLAREVDVPPPQERGPTFETMLTADPPRHERLRGVVEESFRPRSLAPRTPRIEALAADLLADVVDDGAMDVIADFAYPLPVILIAELLGVPADDRPRFKGWSDHLVETPADPRDAEAFAARREATVDELTDSFEAAVVERRAAPRDDLISEIVHAEADGRSLTEREILGFCILLLVAGNVTTTNLLGNAMRCLTAHPDALERLADAPSLVPVAIEEVLRYRSPVQAIGRVAARDVRVGTVRMRAGDSVVGWLGSANRDPAAFDAPDDFRTDRTPNPHLGFGRGTHYRLGAPLARLEARIGLTALLARTCRRDRSRGRARVREAGQSSSPVDSTGSASSWLKPADSSIRRPASGSNRVSTSWKSATNDSSWWLSVGWPR